MQNSMYSSFQIGKLTIPNRLAASAMFEYGAENGRISPKIVEHYETLAKGGAGLIITGMQGVRAKACNAPVMVHTEYETYVQDMQKLAAIVHKEGAKLFVQLQHCGAKTGKAEGYDRFSVSDVQMGDDCLYHEATKEELQKLVTDYARSAVRCRQAGADGVQIHAAHGFLLNSFLSPSTNKRTDDYGGKIENRARFVFEIYGAMREAAGKDFAIGIKFPFSDLKENSILPEESLYVCRELEKRGLDFIEVSAGMVLDGSSASFSPVIRENTEATFLPFASLTAAEVSIPVISVCGYRSPAMVEKALAETKIAAVSFGRPLVREPDLPLRWKKDTSPAACISCNGCCKSFADGIITCHAEKAEQNKKEREKK